MTENVEAIVAGLGSRVKDLEEVKAEGGGGRIMSSHVFVKVKIRAVDVKRFVREFKKEYGSRLGWCAPYVDPKTARLSRFRRL